MTDWSVIFINNWYVSPIVSLKSSSLNMNVLLTALLVATAEGILQIRGASWYVTSHIQDNQKLMWQYQGRVG